MTRKIWTVAEILWETYPEGCAASLAENGGVIVSLDMLAEATRITAERNLLPPADSIDHSDRQAGADDEVVVTEEMIDAATEVLNDSGLLEFGTETPGNWPIVEEMFRAAFRERISFVRKPVNQS